MLPWFDDTDFNVGWFSSVVCGDFDERFTGLISDDKQTVAIGDDSADGSVDDMDFRDATFGLQGSHRLRFDLHFLGAVGIHLGATECDHQRSGSHGYSTRNLCGALIGISIFRLGGEA